MYLKQYGEGIRIFLAFHGWGGDHREFAPLAARLPLDVRLLSADLPGYGQTPKPSRWDLSEIVGEISSELSRLGASPVTLIGFCSGAVVALLVAQKVPARVAHIVMIDPFAFVPWYFRMFVAWPLGRAAYRLAFANPLGRRITTWVLRQRQSTDDDFMAAFARVDHETTLRWMDLFRRVGPASRFAGLAMPVTIVHGEMTFAAVRESVREYRAILPQAEVFELHRMGHLTLGRGAKQLAPIVFSDSQCPSA